MLPIALVLTRLSWRIAFQDSGTAAHHVERVSSSDLAAWGTAIGTLLLAVVAALQDKIRTWVMRPKLELIVRNAPPECQKTSWAFERGAQRDVAPCYYFRTSVLNSGNTEAREVELFAAALSRRQADGRFETVSNFTPMNLLWSHFRNPFLSILSPKIPKVCDLAHVFHPNFQMFFGHRLEGLAAHQVVLAFDLQVEPRTKGHLVGPGIYRLKLILAAANARLSEHEIEIDLPGQWHDDEAQMLRDGFRMRLV